MRIKFYRGFWYAVWIEDGKTRRVSLRTKDRGVAEQRLADLKIAPVGEYIADIFHAYVDDLVARGKSPDRARYAWKALAETFGTLHPDQVTRLLCRGYLAKRRRDGVKDGTIGKELDCLRTALYWHDRATPASFEMPRRPPPRDRYLTRDEYRRLRLAAKQEPHVYVFVVLGVTTAARKQALLELTWDRVDFARRQIRLGTGHHGKGRATVPMNRKATRVLRWARAVAVTDHVIEYAGNPIGSIKKGFAAACRRAGLEGVSPHVLRHTAAVWMAESGVSMSEIAQFLGHADSRLTERVYARYSPDFLHRAAAAL